MNNIPLYVLILLYNFTLRLFISSVNDVFVKYVFKQCH